MAAAAAADRKIVRFARTEILSADKASSSSVAAADNAVCVCARGRERFAAFINL